MSLVFDDKWEKPRPRVFDDNYRGKNKSRKQEERLAEAIGGIRMPASGAICGLKSDASSDVFRGEAKRTSANCLVVKMEQLRKIDKEATAHGQLPCFCIQFDNMPVGVESCWVAVPISIFERMRKLLEKEHEFR